MDTPIYNLQFRLLRDPRDSVVPVLIALIECVPNVSEGRRRDVIDAIADAIRRTDGARLLDVSSDVSHNRSVFTLAGDATGVEQAVMAIHERALAAIDLRTQRGVHPRIGAVDVVPFVPIDDRPFDTTVVGTST